MTIQLPTAPVSPAQRGLWLISELHPDSSLYNVFCSVRLLGPVDLRALRAALQHVVDRHQALRTTFPAHGGVPVQQVADQLTVALPLTDLSALPEADRPDEARALAQRWCEEPFDLAGGPLLRAAVLRLGEREHLLSLALHHIVCDGQSMTVLFDELASFYAAQTGAGSGQAVPPLTAQYPDYVAWQAARAADGGELAWWRSYLDGAPDVLTLPGDRSRPAVRGTAGATRVFDLPGPLAAEVAILARRKRMSSFMVLLAGYAVLLGRLSGAADLLIGMPVADRPLPEFEPLIGLFVDTLPVRVSLAAGQSFEQVLDGARRSVLDVLEHQGTSFDQLVEQVRPDRSPGHTPLIQVAFSADTAPIARPAFAGLDCHLLLPEPTTAKFDLDLSINGSSDGGDGLVGVLTYSTELFDGATIDRFIERFLRLLAAGVADPELPVHAMPLMGEDERALILGQWSQVRPAHPAEPLVYELFARQAAAAPQAPAVSADGCETSYADLDAWSDRIARQLRARGVGPDEIVGLLQERSVSQMATILGILKAGGAYLPLSITHPPAYLARLLTAAQARYAVADPGLAHRLSEAQVAVLDPADLAQPADAPEVPPTPTRAAHPDDLAYVLFTSGSTGEPKGVAITHRSVSNVVATMRGMYDLTAADRVLQFANIGFDIAVEEMFPTWASGACVVLSPEPPPGPEAISELMARERVTFSILTSSYWRQWAADARSRGAHPAPTLRLISIGAEPVDPAALRLWLQETGVPVFNLYGLTETTVNATGILLADAFAGERVPIGRPIDGVQAYVLDPELNPVPVGVEGELHIGGDCLARGYLGRPGLTAARFLPHPYAQVPGARLHRTGDRARWRADGTLDVLGRLDGQLKFRGYRVEPGHIEAAMCSHPGVAAAAVAVRPGPGGVERLIGYVVPTAVAQVTAGDHVVPTAIAQVTAGDHVVPTAIAQVTGDGDVVPGADTQVPTQVAPQVPADLRGHLTGRLPAHLVPSVFAAIPEIPRNANGKADVRALPDPPDQADQAAEHVPARTDLELLLAGIWRDALRLAEVGIHDNFFERGGTSLALAGLLSRLNEALGLRVPLVTLYEYPTIAALARQLSGDGGEAAGAGEQQRAERLRAGRARLVARRGRG